MAGHAQRIGQDRPGHGGAGRGPGQLQQRGSTILSTAARAGASGGGGARPQSKKKMHTTGTTVTMTMIDATPAQRAAQRAARRRLTAEVLYDDAHLLVVNKPSGAILGEGSREYIGVLDLIDEAGAADVGGWLRAVWRIDPAASGLVVYARSREVYDELRRQGESGEAEVRYRALVSGFVAADREIDLALGFDKRSGRLRPSEQGGRPARTQVRVLERVAGNTWVECRPLTFHADQVRIHLAAIGHALTVDPRYGGGSRVMLSEYKANYKPSRRREERPLIERLTLHSDSVRLRHPASGQVLELQAPLPKDLRATLTQLRRLV